MTDLPTTVNIWSTIVESNTFNFVIFVAIIVFIAHKINIKGAIATLQAKIVKIIEDAKKEKEDALSLLKGAEKAVENLESELSTIVDEAHKSAEVISNKIQEEAKKQLENIEQNAKKSIEAEEKLLVAKLTKNTSYASVQTATTKIKDVLAQNPSMHEKYIAESIDNLDRLNF